MHQLTAERALKQMEPLVGRWALEAISPDGELWPGEALATIAWHDRGAFLMEQTTTAVAEAPDSTKLMGCDASNGSYYQLYSDSRGVCRVYEMSIGDGEWKLWRTGDPFPQRFTGRFEDGGDTIAGCWEKAIDGERFEIDFHLIYRRLG